jgi:hypothetical protein
MATASLKDFLQGKVQPKSKVLAPSRPLAGPPKPKAFTPTNKSQPKKPAKKTSAVERVITAPVKFLADRFTDFVAPIAERGGAAIRSVQTKSFTPLKESFKQQFDEMDPNKATSFEDKIKRVSNIALMANLDAGIGKKPGAKPALKEAPKAPKQLGFVESVRTAQVSTPELAQGVKGEYKPITNKQTYTKAQKLVESNFDEALKTAKNGKGADANATGIALIDHLQNSGRFEEAIDLAEHVAKRAKTEGQAIQALSIYSRLSPEGVLRYTQRTIDQANTARGTKIKLKPDAARDIVEQAKNLQKLPEGRSKNVATAKMLQTISDQVPSTFGQKVSSVQTMAQLLNPKTIIRNVVGNAGFGAIENAKDVVATAMDKALSVVTGQRTKSLPSLTTQAKGFMKGARLGAEDALKGIETGSAGTQFDLPSKLVFKSKVMRGAEKTMNLVLKAPDRAAYTASFEESLRQQMKAKGLTQATDEILEVAHHDALYRTFQDDSAMAKVFTGIKKALNVNKSFGVGDMVIKYPKTPGNILQRGIDYSPAGFVQSVYELSKPLMGKGFNQKQFVESTSRALTGTAGLVGTGVLLHKLGIISGKREKDNDIASLQQDTGLGQYRINISALKRFALSGMNPDAAKAKQGDRIVSYDWFQPAAIGISIGANINENFGKSGENNALGQVGTILSSLGAGVDTLAEQPLVQGLTRPFRFNESFGDAAVNTLKGVPASFVPTLLNQIKQLTDNTSRNTYDPNVVKESFNMVKNKIPGAANTLQPRVSVFGQPKETYQGGHNNPLNVLLNPSFTSKINENPEAKMVLDIYRNSGETQQAPRVISTTQKVNGQNKKLTPIEMKKLQEYDGKVTKAYFGKIQQSKTFAGMSDEEKATYLSEVLTDIATAGKIIMLGHNTKKSKRVKKILEEFSE